MRILVTGASGFVGSHLCEALVARGNLVVGVDSHLIGRDENLKSLKGGKLFSFVQADVSVQGVNLKQFGAFDFVCHLASPTAPSETYRHRDITLNVNTLGTLKTLDAAEGWGAGYLFTSSIKVKDAITFESEYIKGKRNGEQFTLQNPKAKIARMGNVYGPRMALDDSRVIPTFCRNIIAGKPLCIWGDGSQIDSFLYIDDCIDALVRMIETDISGVVELGNDQGMSILDLAYMCIRTIGKDVPIMFEQAGGASVVVCNNTTFENNRTARALAAKQRKVPDISVARNVLGWEPSTSIEDGLRLTYKFYEEELSHV